MTNIEYIKKRIKEIYKIETIECFYNEKQEVYLFAILINGREVGIVVDKNIIYDEDIPIVLKRICKEIESVGGQK